MADVIREFLVNLTYKIDSTSQSKFAAALSGSDSAFWKLSSSAAGAATAVAAAVLKITHTMDQLFFSSQRTGTSAQNLTSFGYAAGQVGASADAAASSIENMASRMRRLPGMGQLLNNLGIMRTGDQVQDLIATQKALSNKPMWVQLQYADMLGVEERVWLGLEKMGAFIRQRNNDAARLGTNYKEATENANRLWTGLRRIYDVFYMMSVSGSNSVIRRLGVDLDGFTDKLIKNADTIQRVMQLLLNTILAMAAVFGARLMMTPFGRMLLGLSTLMLLLEDYQTHQRGGNSYYQWGDGPNSPRNQLESAPESRPGYNQLTDPTERGGKLRPEQQTNAAGRMAIEARRLGWSEAMIAGALASGSAESGFDPLAVGDKGNARGMFQWHPDRQALFEKMFGHAVGLGTPEEAIQFANWEMYGEGGDRRGAGPAFRDSKDAMTAGYHFSHDYEGASGLLGRTAEAGKRGLAATSWSNWLGSASGLRSNYGGPGGAGEVINSHNTTNANIVVNGAGDPNAVAGQVVNRLKREENRNLVMNARPPGQ